MISTKCPIGSRKRTEREIEMCGGNTDASQ